MDRAGSLPKYRKATSIAEDIRRRIAAGQFGVGDQLPTRIELQEAYEVSSATLQRALSALLEEGFLEARGRLGTFVTEHPPHLTKYALLFPHVFAGRRPSNQLFRALYEQAEALGEGKEVTCLEGFSGRAGFLEYESLVADVEQNRLAGLIFASAPFMLKGTPLLADDGVPRTAIATRPPADHVTAVAFDHEALFTMAAEYFAARGCRRVTGLISAALDGHILEQLEHRFDQAGVPLGEDDLLGLSIQRPRWVRQIVRLLFRQPRGQRPQGLFLHDDNHLEPATATLAELGLRTPDDVVVVSTANFPLLPVAHSPVHRIGFSSREVLEACIANVDLARQGKTPPALTLIQPMTETLYNQHQEAHGHVCI